MLFLLPVLVGLTCGSQIVRMDPLGFVTSKDSASEHSKHRGEVSEEVHVNAYGVVERITEEEVPVSLLQTALQHSRVVPRSDSSFAQVAVEIFLDSGDENVLLQEEMQIVARPKGRPVVKPADGDAIRKVRGLPKTLHAVHNLLAMSPGSVFATTAGAVAKKSPLHLPSIVAEGGDFVLDVMTTKSRPPAFYALLLVMSVPVLFFVLQSFSAGDLLAAPRMLKKQERCAPPTDARISAEPATVFVIRAARLFGMAGCGGAAEIRGPAECPVLHAVVSKDAGKRALNIGSTATGAEPLVTVGPVAEWSVPQSIAVCRTSTGAVSSLEPLGGGQWVLRRDGCSVFTIECNAQQHTLEVFAPCVPHVLEDKGPLALDQEDQDKQDVSIADEVRQSSQRTVARAALNTDMVEITIVSGDEVVLPLACMFATILMSPELFLGLQ